MHYVPIIDSLCHFSHQHTVAHGIEVGSQIDVDDSCLALGDGLRHSQHRLMRCPLGPVPKRSALEIRLENRLQDELKRSLDHTISDRGNRNDADFALTFWNLRFPVS